MAPSTTPLHHPTAEGFLAFLIPRAAAVHKLAIAAERGGSAAAAAAAAESSSSGPLPHLTAAHLSLVFSNLVSALTLMGAWAVCFSFA